MLSIVDFGGVGDVVACWVGLAGATIGAGSGSSSCSGARFGLKIALLCSKHTSPLYL